MAVKIRLRRMGTKKKPFYRIVVSDSRSPRNGRFIEEIGYYDPLTNPKTIKVDNEKANDWVKKGAKPTDTVDRLFKNIGVYENKSEAKKEVEEVEVEEVKEEKVETTEEKVEAPVEEPAN